MKYEEMNEEGFEISEELREMFLEFRRVKPPEWLRDRIASAMVERKRRFKIKLTAAFAASLIIAIAVSLLLLNPFPERSMTKEKAAKLIEALSQPTRLMEDTSSMLVESILLSTGMISEEVKGHERI